MKVLVVDDHRLFLDGIKSLIAQWRADIEMVEALRLADALAALKILPRPDMVLLDLNLPDSPEPLGTVNRVLEQAGGVPVVAVSMVDDPDVIARLARIGVRGYVRKTDSAAMMLATFQMVLAGGSCIPSEAMGAPSRSGDADVALSDRQREVLQLLVDGLSNKEIARRLAISEPTVKVHVHRILQIVGTTSRGKAAAWARSGGFFPGGRASGT